MVNMLQKDGINTNNRVNTFEEEAMRKVIKESWRGKLLDNSEPKTAGTLQLLDEHAAKMEVLLKNLDYEAICMQNIIINSKHMSLPELRSYLLFIEKLAVGYQSIFTPDITDIILIGLTSKARDLRSIKKYHESLISGVEKNVVKYSSRISKEEKALNQIAAELNKKNRGIFKFLRKGEIRIMQRIITSKKRKLSKYNNKSKKYLQLVSKLK
ncbi:MAG: hypothetical protein ACP5M9_00390 [Candidatus Micrarchaeia archaeon]